MRTSNIICLRRRRGVSTILGTLIFIGVLFTAVIPMFLVMKQADNVYSQNVHEMTVQDSERAMEKVFVAAYPGHSNTIKVKVENRGPISVTIVRVWMNDENFSVNDSISSGSYKILGPFQIELKDSDTVITHVVTERGNIFYSISGGLYYSNGQWFTVSLGISTMIYDPKGGQFRITLVNGTYPSWSKIIYESKCQEWQDVIATYPIDDIGPYIVKIEQKKGNTWKDLPSTPIDVSIDWPDGPPFIIVWVSP
jgi:archaellum component FlaF (FlaF/FlaG flagellin family)